MSEQITSQQFHEAPDVDDWRIVFGGVCAHFRARSFAEGAALAGAIGSLIDADRLQHLDVHLHPRGVTVRMHMYDNEIDGLNSRDVDLARRISGAARALQMPADPAAVQIVQLTIDALVIPVVVPFWHAVLGYEQRGDEDLLDPLDRGPSIWFQQMDAPRSQRNRIHVDVSVPHDQAEARVAAALAAGGRLVSDRHAPAWWTLADPEGNEVDIATWIGRE